MNIKTIYRYAICLFAFLIIIWGMMDLTSGIISALFNAPKYDVSLQNAPADPSDVKNQEPMVEDYYRKKTVYDSMASGASKIIMPGIVFLYFSMKLKREERS